MKSCSVTLFIWVYFRFYWLEVKLCLYFEISKELLKAEGKQIPDTDFTKSLDSVDLSQRTNQVTVPSHSETNLGLLDYETARGARTSRLKKSRSYYPKNSSNEWYNSGKHASEFGAASTLRKFKVEFPQLRESTICSIRSKYDEELKVALKQKREPKSALPVRQRGRPLMLGKIDLMVHNYLQVCYVSINRLIF